MDEIIELQAKKTSEYLQSEEFEKFLGEKVKRNINEIVSNFLDYGDGNKLLKENIQESLKIPLQSWKISETDLIDLIGNIFKSKLESLNLAEKIDLISKGLKRKIKVFEKSEISLQELIDGLKSLDCYTVFNTDSEYIEVSQYKEIGSTYPDFYIDLDGKKYGLTFYKDDKLENTFGILSVQIDKKKVIPILEKLGYVDDIISYFLNLYLNDVKIISTNFYDDIENLDLKINISEE